MLTEFLSWLSRKSLLLKAPYALVPRPAEKIRFPLQLFSNLFLAQCEMAFVVHQTAWSKKKKKNNILPAKIEIV